MKHLSIVTIVATLGACGSKETAPQAGAEHEERAGTGASGEAPADPPPPPAPVEPPEPAAINLETCELTGPPVTSSGFSDPIGDIAVTHDGLAYLLVGKERTEVRRYRIAEGAACRLELDASWGEEGRATFPGKIEELAVDPRGRLFLALDKTVVRYEGGQRTGECSFSFTPKRFAVLDGERLLVNRFMSDFEWITFTADGCERSDWKPERTLTGPTSLDLLGERVIAVAKERANDPFALEAYSFEGKHLTSFQVSPKLGDDAQLCWSNGALACGGGTCIVDSNCRTIKIYGNDGAFKGNVRLEGYPWVAGWAGPHRGAAYLAVSKPGPEGDEQVHTAEVWRASGM